jgi:hypothetical protein
MKGLATLSYNVTTGAVVSIDDFGFDQEDLDRCNAAVLSCHTNNSAVTFTGEDPTANLGHRLVAGNKWQTITRRANVQRLKFLGVSGNSRVTVTLML